MNKTPVILILSLFFLAACNSDSAPKYVTAKSAQDAVPGNKTQVAEATTIADDAAIFAKKEVPVLCYHHIREARPEQSETLKNYSVSPAQFAAQMKALKDSGYESILPDQLYNYLVHGSKLPAKPVMLTFDDTDEEQFSIAAKEMEKYGFKGVYFIMTISINRPRYMTKEQIKQLADNGHAVEAHTWDHHMVTKYQGDDWEKQLVQPKKKVEEITGKPVKYFAYPFGLWNKPAIVQIKEAGYQMAFSLASKRDSTEPLYTVRRILVPGQWSLNGMFRAMKQSFK